MDALLLAHLLAVALWGGLVLGELVLELSSRDLATRRFAARAHYWIDLVAELPLLASIVATGAILTARAWPLAPLLWLKLGAASVAIGTNVYCVVLVVLRHRRSFDDVAVQELSRAVAWTGSAVPFGLLALALGFVLARG